MVIFCKHAEDKFLVLASHGFIVDREQVIDTVTRPDRVLPGQGKRRIAERIMSDRHKLRVVFEGEHDNMTIVTFYPRRIGE